MYNKKMLNFLIKCCNGKSAYFKDYYDNLKELENMKFHGIIDFEFFKDRIKIKVLNENPKEIDKKDYRISEEKIKMLKEMIKSGFKPVTIEKQLCISDKTYQKYKLKLKIGEI